MEKNLVQLIKDIREGETWKCANIVIRMDFDRDIIISYDNNIKVNCFVLSKYSTFKLVQPKR